MHYGAHPDQQVQFYEPERTTARGAVMIIHGGYWREKYTASLGVPLAEDLAARGIPAYNLEYRRGPGSAAKMLADARLALGLVKEEGPITLIGHSAGAQLACVLAAHDARVSQVISQAGVLDLETAQRLKLSGSAVDEMLSGASLGACNPVELWPMHARVVIFHGRDDGDVPVRIARIAAQKAAALGQEHSFSLFAGDHYTWIDPHSSQWAACVRALSPLHY
ncbi:MULTISPECIES: alpha/beta hydrolase [unclassified Glutamicibacter]|uniref:alpha/beta hydrolase n=1 Tax=unclassified Glutamicibacter TaxID=2627139 RepID=UPI002FC8B818